MTDIRNDDRVGAARRAYTTYARTVDWTAVNGDPLPQWDNVSEKIQEAWIRAVATVFTFVDMVKTGHLPRYPHVSAAVHYVSRGSADGMYPPECRAAVITQVCTPAYLGSSKPLDAEQATTVGLFVMNPEGTYHLTLEGTTAGCKYRPAGRDKLGREGGTWHYPEECA
jgi:hypothetical protein